MEKLYAMSKFLLWLIMVVWSLPIIAEEKPYEIFMVQWRGDTETDQGFKDFFENSRIATNYTIRNPQQNPKNFKRIVAEIRRKKPDLIYTWSMASAKGIDGVLSAPDMSAFIKDIPVVNCMVSDPVVAGISETWGKTGRNFTGVSHVASVPSQFQAMTRYRPVKKLSIIFNTMQASPNNAANELKVLADSKGIEVQMLPLSVKQDGKSDVGSITDLLEKAATFNPDFLYIGPDSFLYVNRDTLFKELAKYTIATFTPSDVFLEKGEALFGLVGNYYVAGQYCAYKAAQILTEGKKAGDIPFDTLRNFSMKVNMAEAKRIGLYPPMDLLSITEVIKTSHE